MSTLSIDRLHARYHDVTTDELAALDRALRDVAERALDEACFGRFDVDDFAICIDEIDVDVVVDLGAGAPSAGRQWADQLSAALQRYLTNGGSAVRYRRELDAVQDVCTSFVCGDMERRWAWRQAGVVPASGDVTADVVVNMLRSRRDLVPAVLRSMVSPFAMPLTTLDWIQIAQAVHPPAPRAPTRSGGANGEARIFEESTERQTAPAIASSSALAQLRHQLCAPALQSLWSQMPAAARVDLVGLILVTFAPHLARRHQAYEWVQAQMTALTNAMGPDAADDTSAREAGSIASSQRDRTPSSTQGSAGSGEERAAAEQSNIDQPNTDHRAAEQTDTDSDQPGLPDPRTAPPVPDDVDAMQPLPTPTRNAGVFFLLHAMMELDDVAESVVATNPASDAASPQLARLLATCSGVAITDPAVLIAAGYDLGTFSSAHLGELAAVLSEEEAHRLHQHAAAVDSWLAGRLGENYEEDLSWLWERAGMIHHESGWVEIELALDSVDLRVRTAGLDLDPGFVWWLGSIVRFSYV